MTEVLSEALGDIDLVNPDNYVDDVPFEWFDRLRTEQPVTWHPEPRRNAGFWAVTRYDDLTAIHMDWETFSSEIGAVSLEELDDEQLELRKSMLESDPPRHTQLRQICSKRFSARGVGKYEDLIREVARGVLDRALRRSEFDFVSEISRELPIRFLCSIFTVPQEDAPQLIGWGDKMIANQDPDLSAAVVDKVDTEAYRLLPFRSPTALDVLAYADAPAGAARGRTRRRRDPGAHDRAGRRRAQRARVPQLLLAADDRRQRDDTAHDQPGMLALMEHPEQLQLLQDDPELHPERHRGDPAVGDAGAALPAHGHDATSSCAASTSRPATRWSPGTSARTVTPRCSTIPTPST